MPALKKPYGLEYAESMESVALDGIAKSHPFVFRLQERAAKSFNAHGDLIAPKFIPTSHDSLAAPVITPMTPENMTLASLCQHVDMWHNGVRHDERPWISATFSLPFILYEGQRRAALPSNLPVIPWEPTNAEVIIIDIRPSCMKESSIFLVLHALQEYAGREECLMSESYKRACDFSNVAQEVLLYGHVPHAAVIARWPYATFERAVLPLYHTCLNGCRPIFAGKDKWGFSAYAEHCLSRRRCPIGGEIDFERILRQFMQRLELQYVKWSDGQNAEEALAAVVSSIMYFVLPEGFAGSRDLLELYDNVRLLLGVIRLLRSKFACR